jgi:hypothetical protein
MERDGTNYFVCKYSVVSAPFAEETPFNIYNLVENELSIEVGFTCELIHFSISLSSLMLSTGGFYYCFEIGK